MSIYHMIETPMAKRKDISRNDILDAAQALLHGRGYHGFSFRDLALEIGISSASLHHHFPTKGDLCAAVVLRYRDALNRRLATLAAEADDWPRRWRLMATMFTRADRAGDLLGVLACDFNSLPVPAQEEVRLLHGNLTGWLARFVNEAKKRSELPQESDPEALAHALLALLQGGLLLGRLGVQGAMDGVLRQVSGWVGG